MATLRVPSITRSVYYARLAGVGPPLVPASLGSSTLGQNSDTLVCVKLIRAMPCYKRTPVSVNICPMFSGFLRYSGQSLS